MDKCLFFSCFPDKLFKEGIQKGINYSQTTQAGQKYEKMFVKGLCANQMSLDVLFFYRDLNSLHINEIETFYGQQVNLYGCKLYGNVIKRYFQRKKFISERIESFYEHCDDGFVMTDALNPYSLMVAKYARKKKLRIVTFITDFIDYILISDGTLFRKARNNIVRKIFYSQISYANLSVLMTEAMGKRLKFEPNQYLVIDGMYDELTQTEVPERGVETRKKMLLYAGTICQKFGIDNLINGFLRSNIEGFELCFCGSGDYVEYVKEMENKHDSIRYLGIIPNEEIPLLYKKAYALLNPRPVKDEYTKYSFPSKTIEYMASGVPVITTKLPCITKEYDEFLFYFDDDTVDGIARTFNRLFQTSRKEMCEIAEKAKRYVVSQKEKAVQCRKICLRLSEY